jgi:hypothetical protein
MRPVAVAGVAGDCLIGARRGRALSCAGSCTEGARPMSTSARSVFAFAIYLVGLALVLLIAPNVLLQLFGVPTTSEVWICVVGMLVLFLGFYYSQAARRGMTEFFRWTVFVRSTVVVFFTAFVLLGFVSPMLILFGIVDLLGAIWTGLALRSERSA